MARRRAYPPSVTPGIPRLGTKPHGWREVSFGDVLQVVERPAEVLPDQKYQLVNAKRSRGGIVPREVRLGKQIKTKTQFYVKANDFLISRRQIIHGACGIVPSELDGALVSNEYSTLVPREELLLEYLGYYSHSIHFQQTCFHSSVGVDVEKMVFKLDSWLKHRFYLPPLDTQQEVVRILSTADRAIDRTEKLIAAKRELKKGLAQQLLTGPLPDGSVLRHKHAFSALFVSADGGKNTVPQSDYRADGCFPVVDQGGKLVAGYSNDASALNTDLPLIVFGVHTREVKYIDFPFICGADGTKLLRTTPLLSLEFGYHLLKNTSLPSLGYSRHMRLLRQQVFLVPDASEQERISKIMSSADREIDVLEKKLESLRCLKKGLMQELLTARPTRSKRGP